MYFYDHISVNFSEIEMFQTKFVEEIKTHFVFSNLFSENRVVYEIMWKNFRRAGQATDDSTAHADCMLDN
jgi:hypothetical protein